VIQKCLCFICHSGLDPESSVFVLDSRWGLSRTRYGAGMTASEFMQSSIRFTALSIVYFLVFYYKTPYFQTKD